MNAKSFSITVQGASHIKKNRVCQDSSAHYFNDDYAIAIVCDGHGGDDYVRSDIGSQKASEIAEENIKEFISNINGELFFEDPDKLLRNLEASIISRWNEAVNDHYNLNPFSEDELRIISDKAKRKYTEKHRVESAYGTTVIAVAVTKEYWFGIHIGDGKCVAINEEGKFVQPIPWDSKCFLNATTSICDSDALDSFRHFYSEKLPAAVFVGSDGVDDCFSNNEQLHNLYKTILYSFASSEFESAVADLSDYLPRLSAKGSGDDVSVAAILDMESIPELSIVKEFDREKEKARVEENARMEALKNEEEKKRVEEEHARFQRENNTKDKIKGKRPKFCIYCGNKLNPNSKFCSDCGHPVQYTDITKSRNDYKQVQPIKLPGEGMEYSEKQDDTFSSSSDNSEMIQEEYDDAIEKVIPDENDSNDTDDEDVVSETDIKQNNDELNTDIDDSVSDEKVEVTKIIPDEGQEDKNLDDEVIIDSNTDENNGEMSDISE